jgi:NifB/MoaA-like Fe-S oxidoreductase
MADIVYSNVRELTRQLKAIEPELRKELIRDLKAVAKPVQAAIVARIPSRPNILG